MNTAERSSVDRGQWSRLALLALRRRGLADEYTDIADVADLLSTKTYDGITIRALYTPGAATGQATGVGPDAPPQRSPGTAWRVRQRYSGTDAESLLTALHADTANGVDEVWLSSDSATVDSGVLSRVLEGVELDRVGVVLDPGAEVDRTTTVLLDAARRRGIPASALTGNLGADPLGTRARTGHVVAEDLLGRSVARCVAELPGMRAVTVDVTGYQDAGASDADVIAFSIATGVAYLRHLVSAGLSVSQAMDQLEFRYAVTSQQFDTIALLRAARRLWARVSQACDASGAGVQRQHALTSSAMMTARDSSGNMLRTTVAAFAAVVGGADAVTVQPFDMFSGAAVAIAGRVARNTHAILREEAHIHRVADPAGGSWYVEQLTAALAECAWDRFQEIERAGGMGAALDGGSVAGWAEATWRARRADVARRAPAIVGVSRFLDTNERPPHRRRDPSPCDDRALPVRRPAAVFEALWDRADVHTATTGERPVVFLVPFGPRAARTAKVDFATDLFGVGGLTTVAGPVADADAVAAAFTASGSRVACLCGPEVSGDDPVVRALNAAGAAWIWAVGAPAETVGVSGYLFDGCDVVEAVETTFTKLEMR